MIRWNELTLKQQQDLLMRPALSANNNVEEAVNDIIKQVKLSGDKALITFAEKFDKRKKARLKVPEEEIYNSAHRLSKELKEAIDTAYNNIKAFHKTQLPNNSQLETTPGVLCELRYQAIDAVGLYVPGGSAPLPSSVLMQGVCAQLSGARTIVLATPVNGDQKIDPAILYAAKLCGITTVIESGGAGAIAAMAFGTDTVPKVSKVFGPGNSYVTMAKQILSQIQPGFAIDMPAGPSEVLVIADKRANPDFIAADLLSQAEHGPDSQVILVCTDQELIIRTQQALDKQLALLSRADIARAAMKNSSLILVESLEQAFEVSAEYGPEHLILQLDEPEQYLPLVFNAGSVFVGDFTPESAGDYASGTNHVLPTYGYSKVYSSLSLLDFFRTFTVQTISKQGLTSLSTAILPLAEAEGLDAHAYAVKVRLEQINNDQ